MSGEREGWLHWAGRMTSLAAKAVFRATFTPFPILNQGLVRNLIGNSEDTRLLHFISYALAGRVCESWDELLVQLPQATQLQFDTAAVFSDEVSARQNNPTPHYRMLLCHPQAISVDTDNQLGEMALALFKDLFETREDGNNNHDVRLKPGVSENRLKLSKALMSICVGYTVVLEKFRHKTLRQEVLNTVKSFFSSKYALMQQLSDIEQKSFLPILKPAFTDWLRSLHVPQLIIDEIFSPSVQTLLDDTGNPTLKVQLRTATQVLLARRYPRANALFKDFEEAYQDSDVPFLGWLLRLSQFLIILLPEKMDEDQPPFMQALASSFTENWQQWDDFLNRVETLMETFSQAIRYDGAQDRYPVGLFGNDAAMMSLLNSVDPQGIIPPMLGKAVHMIGLVRDILKARRETFVNAQGNGQRAGSLPFEAQGVTFLERLSQISRTGSQGWAEFCTQRDFRVNTESSPLSLYRLMDKYLNQELFENLRKGSQFLKRLGEEKQNYQAILQLFATGQLLQAEGIVLDIIDGELQEYLSAQPDDSVAALMLRSYLNANPVDKEKARQALTSDQKRVLFSNFLGAAIQAEPDGNKKDQLTQLGQAFALIYTPQDPVITEGQFRQLVTGVVTHEDDPALAAEMRKHCAHVQSPSLSIDLTKIYKTQIDHIDNLKGKPGYREFLTAVQKMNDYFDDPITGRRTKTRSYNGFNYSRSDCDQRMESWKKILDNISNYLKEPGGIEKLHRFLALIDDEIHRFKGFHIPLIGTIHWFSKEDWRWQGGQGANWILLKARFRSFVKSLRRFTCWDSGYANHLKKVRSTLKNLVYVDEVQPQLAARDPIESLIAFNMISYNQLKAKSPGTVKELEEEEREWQEDNPSDSDDEEFFDVSSQFSDMTVCDTDKFPEQENFYKLGESLQSIASFYEQGYSSLNSATEAAAGNHLVYRVWKDEHQPNETISDVLEEAVFRQAALLQAEAAGFLKYWHLATLKGVQAFDHLRLDHGPKKSDAKPTP